MEKKKKDEQNGKNLTLFSFLQHQDKGETTDARVTREAASSSCIMVGPSVATQLLGSAARDDKTVGARKAREEGGSLVDKKRLKPEGLSGTLPKILEHVATHLLFNNTVDTSQELCGLCMWPRPSPLVFEGPVQSGFFTPNGATSNCNQARLIPDVGQLQLDHLGLVYFS